ncbi:MAG: DUF2868 domain-containing protein [Oceanospirillales bacterium]|nr:MAG: DUF2868 domain-containing protein [Oceanospirillales bacterium]
MKLQLPIWLYIAALLFGVVMGVAGLQYTPDGRINLMLIWLIWCGLPFIGACISGVMMFRRHQPPWLVRFAKLPGWQVDNQFQLRLWFKLHQLWCLVGVGILLAFLTLLMFTDLAFGWSSTLISDPDRIHSIVSLISFHWQAYWPAAVPDAALIEATRFVRIAPNTENISNAGDWWPFILASLLIYNLLPRCLLISVCMLQIKHAKSTEETFTPIAVTSDASMKLADADQNEIILQHEPISEWQSATIIYWEAPTTTMSDLQLGVADWEKDQSQWKELLAKSPKQLLWKVDLRRSPIAELADKVQQANQKGIKQALLLIEPETAYPSHLILSWQAFAKQHQLIWIQ